ncbi:MAG: amidohydrolase family protein [Cyclobacteriaceae bacterium]
MKFFASLLFNCVVFTAAFSQDLLISGGHLFRSIQGDIIENPGLLIRNGIIEQIGITQYPEEIKKLVLSDDDYLLPGLIDLHGHYRVSYAGVAKDDTVAMPKIFLANGVTATFPAGEVEPEKMLDLRKRIDSGERPGPRILSSGPYYGSAAPDWDNNFTDQDIYDRVDKWVANGAVGFKAKNITHEHLKALVTRADHHELTVTGHLNSGVGTSVNPADAIEIGIDRVEHFLGGELLADTTSAYNSLKDMDPNDPRLDNIIQQYINNGVYFDATVGTYGAIGNIEGSAFEPWEDERAFLTPFTRSLIEDLPKSEFSLLCEKIYPVKCAIIKRYYDAGGLITIGTDRPFLIENYLGDGLGGFFIHREMQIMVEAGIPASEVLRFATIQNATAIGLEDEIGSISVGKSADIIVIKGDPLEDITNTRSVHLVLARGRLFESSALLNAAQGKLGPTSEAAWLKK